MKPFATPLIGVVSHSASSVATTTKFGHEWARCLGSLGHFALKAMFRFITILLFARLGSVFMVLEGPRRTAQLLSLGSPSEQEAHVSISYHGSCPPWPWFFRLKKGKTFALPEHRLSDW